MLQTYGFFAAVAGDLREGVVDVEDDAGGIGNDDAFGGVREDAGCELEAGFGALAGGDVLSKDDDAADGSGSGEPWTYLPAQPLHGAVGTIEAIFVVLDGFAAEGATMNGEPPGGDIRKYFVMGSAENVGAAKAEVVAPAAADGDVSHIAIEHGESGGSVLGEELKQFFALAEIGFSTLSLGDVLDSAAHRRGLCRHCRDSMRPVPWTQRAHVIVVADDAIFAIENLASTRARLQQNTHAILSRSSG